jgi:hypothetical protein
VSSPSSAQFWLTSIFAEWEHFENQQWYSVNVVVGNNIGRRG